jgi:hypothetical protein
MEVRMLSNTGRETYEVLQPTGESAYNIQSTAPRLDTLNGKTVCEVWNTGYRGDRTFPKIRELLKQRYPGVKIIPYTELPFTRHYNIDDVLKDLPRLLKEKGCDALISGNGG